MHTARRTRRTFLKAAGVALALPRLDAFAQPAAAVPRRAVFICAPLGLHAPYFFPTAAGRDYALTPYLEPLRDLRNDFTVVSGLAHPDVGPSHDSIFSFLTCAPHPERRAGFRNTVSVDQLAAEHVGGETRFPSLPLSAEGFGLSWTRTGALVPPDLFPASVFARLFLDGRPEDVANQARRLRDGRSVLDAVRDQAADMRPALGTADRDKLDEYFTSVRELERRLARAEEWSRRPKPKVDARPPQNVLNPADLVGKTRSLFDLIHLALQTDSTRLVTMLMLGTSLVPPIAGVSFGHHDLSHHGQDPAKIAQLRTVEQEKMKALADFLTKLKATREDGASLLDRTTVFFSSNLGNAATHGVRNLPVLVAGGGFRHGQHLAFDPSNGPPLGNLFVSMLQRLGVPADRFGSGTATLRGLDPA
ncbi:DUF1552 domain-containing protein [Urbifossiella limnaea]|uniref:DUF1552 domain-containing protein n=1 Tax=Urbifossiella limnaea TaxID=2528023 RepID=A0A517XTX8_9BACT|nr:DUF1552 domain-containing protein [Urbifossiella limnaea]QDU20937.1 hypothetical protein ETAA1_29000 [Urbifossiella limnaea]